MLYTYEKHGHRWDQKYWLYRQKSLLFGGTDSLLNQEWCSYNLDFADVEEMYGISTHWTTPTANQSNTVKLCTALAFTGEQRYIIKEISETQNIYICDPSSQQEEV